MCNRNSIIVVQSISQIDDNQYARKGKYRKHFISNSDNNNIVLRSNMFFVFFLTYFRKNNLKKVFLQKMFVQFIGVIFSH